MIGEIVWRENKWNVKCFGLSQHKKSIKRTQSSSIFSAISYFELLKEYEVQGGGGSKMKIITTEIKRSKRNCQNEDEKFMLKEKLETNMEEVSEMNSHRASFLRFVWVQLILYTCSQTIANN